MYFLYLLLVNILLILPAAFAPIFPMVFADDILLGGRKEWMIPLILLMVGMALCSGALQYLREDCMVGLKQKTEEKMGHTKEIVRVIRLSVFTGVFETGFYFTIMIVIHPYMAVIVLGTACLNVLLNRTGVWLHRKYAAENNKNIEMILEPMGTLPEVFCINLLLLICSFRIMDPYTGFSMGTYLALQAYADTFFYSFCRLFSARQEGKDER